mmetsp:Transcript_34088/g.81816  ORF Transcript_34088/g.81816 Transcript_34088/m.81816 type:complete len:210 (-) Transcript_34088:550-1179(-)
MDQELCRDYIVFRRANVLRANVCEDQAEQKYDKQQKNCGPRHSSQCAADTVKQRFQGADELHQAHDADGAGDLGHPQNPDQAHAGAHRARGMIRRLSAQNQLEHELQQAGGDNKNIQENPGPFIAPQDPNAASQESQQQLAAEEQSVERSDDEDGIAGLCTGSISRQLHLDADKDRVGDDHRPKEAFEHCRVNDRPKAELPSVELAHVD